MSDDRLSSGMKITEAVASAERWWDTVGRGLVPRQLNRIDKGRTSFGKAGPMIKIRDVVHDLPSGILQALPWEDLTRSEQLQIVKHWHQEFVVKPNVQALADAAQRKRS